MVRQSGALALLLFLASAAFAGHPLGAEKSRYLREHADNLVQWNAWNPATLAKAKKEGKLVFLSIGYAACHWCHVMERESFMDVEVSRLINERFTPILVDREEHPDVDATYVAILQAMNGTAGWPANLILTPELKPLIGSSYVRRDGLIKLLTALSERWTTNRDALTATSDSLLAMAATVRAAHDSPPAEREKIVDAAFARVRDWHDAEFGGFGMAPKFPQPLLLEFLLRYGHLRKSAEAREIVTRTMKALDRSALHDTIEGGFHRYAVDRQWRVPHFEKMLHDQALIAGLGLAVWQSTGDARMSAVVRSTLDFVLRDLGAPGGAFFAALDADSAPRNGGEHAEGAYYVWSFEELRSLVGEETARALGALPPGNVTAEIDRTGELKGLNILRDAHTLSGEAGAKLAAARRLRPRPAVDDKILTGWNGLAISALARAGAVLEEPRYVAAAERAARFIDANLWNAKTRTLYRRYAGGSAGIPALAEDYAMLVHGLLDLHEATQDVHWLDRAVAFQARQDALFWSEERGVYSRGGSVSAGLSTIAPDSDGATPSANSTSVLNLLRLAELRDRDDLRKRASTILERHAGAAAAGAEMPWMTMATMLSHSAPRQIVIAGSRSSADTMAMLRKVHQRYIPNRVVIVADEGNRQAMARHLPIVRDMLPIDGRATAYVCEHYVCKLPTSDPEKLSTILEK